MNRGQTNPVFSKVQRETEQVQGYGASYKGIIFKTMALLLATLVSGAGSLFLATLSPNLYIVLLIIAPIVGTISVIVASVSPRMAPAFSFVYAAAEGTFLGMLTFMYSVAFDGVNIVGLAVLITLGIFIGMLVLYSTRLVVATSRFRKVMYGVSFGILAVMLLVSIISIFDGGAIWHSLFGDPNSPIVLFLSLLFVFYGAFMLILNFDNAQMIVSNGADKKYEWTVSLGLIISLIYIYVQVLRLLAIIFARSQDN